MKNWLFFKKGFGIYYKDENNAIDCIFFDVVSQNSQDAFTVVNSLKLLRKQDWFVKIDKKKYIIWADTGIFKTITYLLNINCLMKK